MTRETQEKTIDGIKFITHQMNPLKLYPLAPRVALIAAPALAELGGFVMPEVMSKLKGGNISEDDVKAVLAKLLTDPKGLARIAPVLEIIARGLADPMNAKLPQELLARTEAIIEEDGEKTKLDLSTEKDLNKCFRGRFFTLLKVMWFAAGANFSDFSFGGSPSDPSKA